jgi:hypothetical protein
MEPMPPPPPAADAPVAAGAMPNLKWEGLVDSYYMYNFTGEAMNDSPQHVRSFDVQSNSFTLAYAKLALQMDADPVGFRVDFGYGHVGTAINAGSGSGSGGGQTTSAGGPGMMGAASLYNSGFIMQQAYATARMGVLTLDAGKFVTTAGSEVIESNKNWLYSRSILFYFIPLVHTGLRATIKPTDTVSLQASVVNGANANNDPDNNTWKTLGLSLGLTPVEGTSLALTSYFGKETLPQEDTQILIDLVASQTISDAFGLNLNVDYIKSGPNKAFGAALMARLSLSEAFYLALRGEYFKLDPDGDTGDGAFFEGTLMGGLPIGSNYEIRLELRGDFSDEEVFRVTPMGGEKNQFTGTAAFLAFF